MRAKDETTFTRQTTTEPVSPEPAVTMMSEAGRKLASYTAPSDAYVVRTSSTPAVKEK